MSVSLSSVYQQTESLREIQQKFEQALQNEQTFDKCIDEIVSLSSTLTMSQSYRLLVVLSKSLNNNSSVNKKYAALYIIKKLILTGFHHYYIFTSVRALGWIVSTMKFQIRKKEHERVKSYIKQLSLKGNGDQVYQQRQCYKLLKLVDEFLPWFSQHIPIHINAQFQFRSIFVRAYQQILPKKSYKDFQNFSQNDFKIFQNNFNRNKGQNKEQIKQLCQFISLEVKTLIDQQKYKSQLLKQIIRTADSHCIRTIISEVCTLIEDSSKLFSCLKLVQSLINMGEIQFVELVKLYVVPGLLGYILPYNFVEGKKIQRPPLACSFSEEKCIIDFICIWCKITEKMGLSTQFYTEAMNAIKQEKGNLLGVQQNHISEFLTKVIDMQTVNNDKRPHIRYKNIQDQLINVLSLKQSKASQPIKMANQWKLKASAINELNQFKESKIDSRSQNSQTSSLGGLLRNLNSGSIPFISSGESLKSPEKQPVIIQRNSQQLISFRDVISSTKQPLLVAESNVKQASLQIYSPNRIHPINEQSSFMAFNESHLSKFEQYSVKKSKEADLKPPFHVSNGSRGGLLKQQFMGSSGASPKNSIRQSKGDSVVYFQRSEDFHSEFSGRQSNTKEQKKQPKMQISIAKSLKFNNNEINEQSVSTYRFDSSKISKNSNSTSSIQNYGKQSLEFPPSVPKPTFGFKKKQQQYEIDKNIYTNERILGSQVNEERKEPGLSKIIEENYQRRGLDDQASSEIKDLSGGKHRINQSIQFSQASQLSKKQHITQQNNRVGQLRNPTPYTQYFQSTKLEPDRQKYANQNNNQNQLRMSLSQKKLLASQQFLRSPERNKQQSPHKSLSTHGNKVASFSNIGGKKRHVIIDQFANDRLLDLEKQLGKAMEEKNMKEQQLKKRQAEYKLLKSKSIPYMGRKVQTLKKQDQIIKILLDKKTSQEYSAKAGQYIKPIKNNNRISDYFLQNEMKGTFSPKFQCYDRIFTKQILGSRCLLMSNQNLQLGYNYSQIQNQVSFYITFHKIFDFIRVSVVENSVSLEKPVDLILENQPAGYQVKIKRKLKQIKSQKKQPTFSQIINETTSTNYKFPQIQIKLIGQSSSSSSSSSPSPSSPSQQIVLKTTIPCSIFNLVKPIDITSQIVQQLKGKKVLVSQIIPLSQEFARNCVEKVGKCFGKGMGLVDGWVLIGFSFPTNIFQPQENEYIKFKIFKGRDIKFEIFNNPKSLLLQSIICLLTSNPK